MWTVHTLSLHSPRTAIPQQSPSAPKALLFTGHTLITSLIPPYSPLHSSSPPHVSPCHFNIPLLAPFRPLPPVPASPAASAVGRGRVPPTHALWDCWPWWLDLAAAMINASTRQEASTSACQTNIYLLKHIILVWGHTSWWTNPNLDPNLAIALALIFPQPILHNPGNEPLFDIWQKNIFALGISTFYQNSMISPLLVCYLTLAVDLDVPLMACMVKRETPTRISNSWLS